MGASTLVDYFSDIVEELKRQSERLKQDFDTHRPSAGQNRESLVAGFLSRHLPEQFAASTGLILSSDGAFSRQADVIIVDRQTNAPLYSELPNPLWLVESVYCVVEVKSRLTNAEFKDTVAKCRRFKTLQRRFSEAPSHPRSDQSLFVIWAFEGPESKTINSYLREHLAGVPADEQPDFLVVPDRVVAKAGRYHITASVGDPGSAYRRQLEAQGVDIQARIAPGFETWEMGKYSLLVWLALAQSWLIRAGTRTSELLSYLPPNEQWGTAVTD